jgi:hypothetical protein
MQAFGKRLVIATVMVGLVFLAYGSPVLAQAADPVIGTWKLDVAKSKYSPGPPPKSLTAKFEAAGKGVKLTTDGVGADGQPTHTEYTADYDGKDYPLMGSPMADTVSLKRIDASTSVRTDKKGGKVVQTLTRKMSSDGKSFSVTVKGTNPKGEPFNNVLVFVKQ